MKSSPYLIICNILDICTKAWLSNNVSHQVSGKKMWAWSSVNYGHSYHLSCHEILVLPDCCGMQKCGYLVHCVTALKYTYDRKFCCLSCISIGHLIMQLPYKYDHTKKNLIIVFCTKCYLCLRSKNYTVSFAVPLPIKICLNLVFITIK